MNIHILLSTRLCGRWDFLYHYIEFMIILIFEFKLIKCWNNGMFSNSLQRLKEKTVCLIHVCFEWHIRFSEGCQNVEYDECPWWPSTSRLVGENAVSVFESYWYDMNIDNFIWGSQPDKRLCHDGLNRPKGNMCWNAAFTKYRGKPGSFSMILRPKHSIHWKTLSSPRARTTQAKLIAIFEAKGVFWKAYQSY